MEINLIIIKSYEQDSLRRRLDSLFQFSCCRNVRELKQSLNAYKRLSLLILVIESFKNTIINLKLTWKKSISIKLKQEKVNIIANW